VRPRFPVVAAFACALAVPTAGHASNPVERIWPLGDSITVGSSWPQAVPGGYRADLDQILSHDGFPHLFVGTSTQNPSPTLQAEGQVAHDGHGGFRIDQVLRDIDQAAHGKRDNGGRWLTGIRGRRAITPDIALIHLGTNDILQDWDTRRFPTHSGRADLTSPWQRGRFVDDMTSRLDRLILRIHALRPKCTMVIATVVPIAGQPLTTVTSSYAAAVRHLVLQLRAARYPVILADLYAAFMINAAPGAPVTPGLLTSDGVHPTAAGYAVIGRAFALAVTGSRESHVA
jgi:lysophospholipase L1-like esterase